MLTNTACKLTAESVINVHGKRTHESKHTLQSQIKKDIECAGSALINVNHIDWTFLRLFGFLSGMRTDAVIATQP